MTPEEFRLLNEMRDGIDRVLAESKERSRTLERVQYIVERLEQQTAALEVRMALLERPHARA